MFYSIFRVITESGTRDVLVKPLPKSYETLQQF